MYMYRYMYMCVCVCVCVWEREGREGREWSVGEYVLVRMCVLCVLIPSAVSLNSFIRHSECLEESATCCSLDLFSNLEWARTRCDDPHVGKFWQH